MLVGDGVPGAVGSNTTTLPPESTTTQMRTVGHAMPVGELAVSMLLTVAWSGDAGSNVTSCPLPSTAVHWVVAAQATAVSSPVSSIVVGVGAPGDVGSKVASSPRPTAVHRLAAEHATARKAVPTVTGVGVAGAVGSNVTSSPTRSTAVHCWLVGQASPLSPPAPAPGAIGTSVEVCAAAGSNVTS